MDECAPELRAARLAPGMAGRPGCAVLRVAVTAATAVAMAGREPRRPTAGERADGGMRWASRCRGARSLGAGGLEIASDEKGSCGAQERRVNMARPNRHSFVRRPNLAAAGPSLPRRCETGSQQLPPADAWLAYFNSPLTHRTLLPPLHPATASNCKPLRFYPSFSEAGVTHDPLLPPLLLPVRPSQRSQEVLSCLPFELFS